MIAFNSSICILLCCWTFSCVDWLLSVSNVDHKLKYYIYQDSNPTMQVSIWKCEVRVEDEVGMTKVQQDLCRALSDMMPECCCDALSLALRYDRDVSMLVQRAASLHSKWTRAHTHTKVDCRFGIFILSWCRRNGKNFKIFSSTAKLSPIPSIAFTAVIVPSSCSSSFVRWAALCIHNYLKDD